MLTGNIVYLLLDISHPSVLLFSCIIVLIGIAIFIAAMGLSQLIRNAAELQEENELTI